MCNGDSREDWCLEGCDAVWSGSGGSSSCDSLVSYRTSRCPLQLDSSLHGSSGAGTLLCTACVISLLHSVSSVL